MLKTKATPKEFIKIAKKETSAPFWYFSVKEETKGTAQRMSRNGIPKISACRFSFFFFFLFWEELCFEYLLDNSVSRYWDLYLEKLL